jgi:hypothetical protein
MTATEILHSVVCMLVVTRPLAGRPKAATGNSLVFCKPSKLSLSHTEPLLVGVSGAVARAAKWRGREANHSPPSSTEATQACLHDMHRYSTVCPSQMTLRGCHTQGNQLQLQLAVATTTQGNSTAEYQPLSQTMRGRTFPAWF